MPGKKDVVCGRDGRCYYTTDGGTKIYVTREAKRKTAAAKPKAKPKAKAGAKPKPKPVKRRATRKTSRPRKTRKTAKAGKAKARKTKTKAHKPRVTKARKTPAGRKRPQRRKTEAAAPPTKKRQYRRKTKTDGIPKAAKARVNPDYKPGGYEGGPEQWRSKPKPVPAADVPPAWERDMKQAKEMWANREASFQKILSLYRNVDYRDMLSRAQQLARSPMMDDVQKIACVRKYLEPPSSPEDYPRYTLEVMCSYYVWMLNKLMNYAASRVPDATVTAKLTYGCDIPYMLPNDYADKYMEVNTKMLNALTRL